MCKQCTNDKENGLVGLLTSDNNMNPGRVPPPLKDLSVVEEMLIAQIAPMMHIFRLTAGRQFGYPKFAPKCAVGFDPSAENKE